MYSDELMSLEQKIKKDLELKENSKLINFLIDYKLKKIEKKFIVLNTKENILNNFLEMLKINNLCEIKISGMMYHPVVCVSFGFEPKSFSFEKEKEFGTIPCLMETKIMEAIILEFRSHNPSTNFYSAGTNVLESEISTVFNDRFAYPKSITVYPYRG